MRYVHIEGVNFNNTILDTSDISTVRGASRAYEDIVAAFAKAIPDADIITCGASKLTAKTALRLSDLRAKLSGVLKVLAEGLSFVEGEGDTVEAAIARAQISALRQWTVEAPTAGIEACALSHRQAAEVTGGIKGNLSRFVHQRREYGLAYRRNLVGKDFRFARDFEELVQTKANLPLSASAKFAAVYVDGAGFGAALAALINGAGESAAARDSARKAYSAAASSLQNDIVNKAMLWAQQVSDDDRLQLEVLLAGGDDMIFVVPAWKLMDFLTAFADWTSNAKLAGHPVWFRAGCIIAHHKTPIRQVLGLAEAAVNEMRAARAMPARNEIGLYSIDVLESAAPPPDGLESHRRRRFGASVGSKSFCWPLGSIQDLKIAIDGARSDERDAQLRPLPPRSQIFRLLAGLEDLGQDSADETIRQRYSGYAAVVQGMVEGQSAAILSDAFQLDGLGRGVPLALQLAFVTELWDYTGDMTV